MGHGRRFANDLVKIKQASRGRVSRLKGDIQQQRFPDYQAVLQSPPIQHLPGGCVSSFTAAKPAPYAPGLGRSIIATPADHAPMPAVRVNIDGVPNIDGTRRQLLGARNPRPDRFHETTQFFSTTGCATGRTAERGRITHYHSPSRPLRLVCR